MVISEIDQDKIHTVAGTLENKDPIYCAVSEGEKSHLFHKVGMISKFIRGFLFPLSCANSAVKDLVQREEWISNDLFWNVPFHDLRYPYQQEIRDHFIRYDQYVIVQAGDKEIKLKCRVIEPQGLSQEEECLNHLVIQGNVSTLDNNMPGIYPFLESYLKQKKKDPDMKPGRFIILNHYEHKVCDKKTHKESNYLPGDLDEWGFVFKKTFSSLVDRYGKFQLVAAHSLGNIPVVEHLKHMNDEEFTKMFPKTLFLAQGPSSIYEISRNLHLEFEYCPRVVRYVMGLMLYHLSKWTGWNIRQDKTLVDRLDALSSDAQIGKQLKKTNIIISEVKHDYYFPEKASLCAADNLDRLRDKVNLYRMSFNPPLSWGVPRAQHNYNVGLLQRQDLVKEKVDMEEGKHIVHLNDPKVIIDHAYAHDFILRHGESLVDTVLRSAWSCTNASNATMEGRTYSVIAAA